MNFIFKFWMHAFIGQFTLWSGGGGSSTTGATTTTNNLDERMAVQDGIGVNGEGNIISYNSTDAVKAVAAMGADVIKSTGGAVVELYKDAGQTNADAWKTTMDSSAKLVDKLIDQVGAGFSLSEKAIAKFEPTENKNADIGKYAMVAAAVVAASVIFKGQK